MGGIAGILQLDGGPVDAEDVSGLASGVAPLGRDGVRRWEGEAVALVHALSAATPETVGEEQPVVDGAGRVALTLDGRLDNRDDLLGALARHDPRGAPPVTDAQIALQAYESWGAGFVARLLGDFALAVWDGRRRRLLLARDPIGIRPLLYRVERRRLAWSSTVKPLAFLHDAPTRPNPGMVAEYLASALTSRSETVYESVLRLPPATCLTVEGGTVRLRTYWDIDPAREVRHGSHDEYAEHLREVLTLAVRARRRTVGPVVAELSGGIDSSTVVGIAQREAQRNGTSNVVPLSLVYPGEACDESPWIDAVADRWGLETFKLTPGPASGVDFVEATRRTGEVPDYPAFPHWGGLYARAGELGARSVLNGLGGDELFTGTSWETADLLRSGRIDLALARARRAARADGMTTRAALWRRGVRPALGAVLPASVPNRVRARRRARGATWIPADFASSVDLDQRLRTPVRAGFRSLAQSQIWNSVVNGELVASNEATASFLNGFGLEPRMPFLDVRVVELAFAVPEAERNGGRRPKHLLRTAARDLLPDGLTQRLDTPGPTHLIVQAIRSPVMAPHLSFPRLGAAGWIDPQRVGSLHAELAGWHVDSQRSWNLWPMWRALAVELWLGEMFGPSRARRL